MHKLLWMLLVSVIIVACLSTTPALAREGYYQVASSLEEVSYVLNSFMLLLMGAMVMFMSAGFAMFEAGMVRAANVTNILIKNIALYAVSCVFFYMVGYNIMYSHVDGGYMGEFQFWVAEDTLARTGTFSAAYTSGSFLFFQMVFCATAASIVSGALAERMLLRSFLTFTIILAAFIYPIAGAWVWGGGWLDVLGFQDFAGGSIVHATGGWAALVGVWLTGARTQRHDNTGKQLPITHSNIAQVTLGTCILWFGWFGFNAGSLLSMSSGFNALQMTAIFINTNMAACGGLLMALLLCVLIKDKLDPVFILNGALVGLVSITADPLHPTPFLATLIGGAGAVVVVVVSTLLKKLHIDDAVGAIPVHLGGGVWGCFALLFSNPHASFMVQAIGVSALAGFVCLSSLIAWLLVRFSMGLRVSREQEARGLDSVEMGVRAYNIDM